MCASVVLRPASCRSVEKRVFTPGKTSEREYEVDAQALKADEGRGDRRNVQGELHASDEP